MTAARRELPCSQADVRLRPFPYPYRCMLAICSDLDGTPDHQTYLELMRFLNTTQMTSMGPGVGLEVGNSIHFRANPPQFSYWDTDDAGRKMAQELIRSGHIDCLHSFGERVYTRDEARRALEELEQHGCRLEVWVDHGGAVTNFGRDIMQGHGDMPGHAAYHADLSVGYGIRYVWRGQTTSLIGQDRPAGLDSVFDRQHPIASSRTLLKEAAKRILAAAGNKRYSMHRSNALLRRSILRDGSPVYEFLRCNPHWRGPGFGDRGRFIGEILTDGVLRRLIEREGTCILYTHLGRTDGLGAPFGPEAVKGLQRLAASCRNGDILVTTTRRLLGYRRAVCEIRYEACQEGGTVLIDVDTRSSQNGAGGLSLRDLSGLTFYVADPMTAQVRINGKQLTNIRHNAPDQSGWPSVSLPWDGLEFPQI